jgi:hypothetical protein
LLELCDTIMKDVENKAGVSFKFQRWRQPFHSKLKCAITNIIIKGSITQLKVTFSKLDIREIIELFIYKP